MPSIRPKRYYGVSFENRTLGPKKWRCQIMRQNLVIFLGAYETAEAAGRAYDNASYYLGSWSEQIPRYNFPAEWTGETVPPINIYSTRALAKLKERFPNWEREKELMENMTEFERMQRDALIATEGIALNLGRVRTALLWCYGQLKLQDEKIRQHAEEIALRDRIIAGLRISGGKPIMTPVVNSASNLLDDPV